MSGNGRVSSTVYAPRLQPVWLVAASAVVAATVVLAGVYVWLDSLVPPSGPESGPASATGRTLDIAKVAIAMAGFVGAVLTGVYAYREQRLAEGDARRADAEQLGVRFGRAFEQLGHNSAAVRLAGVYAMAALADEWAPQRQLCINVLIAYLQVPYQPDPRADNYLTGEKEVHRNVLRVIRDHLGDGFSDVSWRRYNFRFEGTVFDGGDLSGARFTSGYVTFHGVRFVGETFHFDAVRLEGARVWFTGARFDGGNVRFRDVVMSAGTLSFKGAVVDGGSLTFAGFSCPGGDIDEGPFTGQIRQLTSAP